MDAQAILDLIKAKNLKGTLSSHPEIEVNLLPSRLVFKYPGQIDTEVFYDKDFNPILWKLNGKEYSNKLEEDSVLRGQFLNRDPRFCIRNAKDFKQIGPNSYSMVIWKDKVILLGEMRVEVEIEVISQDQFVMTRKKFIKGNKELKNQTEIIRFS